jgi:hypothetical protein
MLKIDIMVLYCNVGKYYRSSIIYKGNWGETLAINKVELGNARWLSIISRKQRSAFFMLSRYAFRYFHLQKDLTRYLKEKWYG